MKEPHPVPPVPKWLCMTELMQTTTPLRRELPLPSPSVHMMDICVQSPAIWSWMATLLQYWQDHISAPLYGRRVRKASKLADTLMRDINPWMPHKVRFGWDYVIDNAATLLDICEQFVEEHFQEWEAQKRHAYELGTLEHTTEFTYHKRLTKRQAESDAADSCEEEAKKLPQECQAVQELRKQQAMRARDDVCPAGTESSFLYPHWELRKSTKLPKVDKLHPYKVPKDEREKLSLEEELDAKSVFDPLVPSSQSSSTLGSQLELAGPKTPLHFTEDRPASIMPFDLSLARDTSLSPVTEQDNALLSLAPGSPKKGSVGFSRVPGGSISGRGSGCTSCADSPMSVGSLAGLDRGAAFTKALKA